jgi:hypothetical protein
LNFLDSHFVSTETAEMNGTETPLTKYVISRVFEIIVKVCPVRLASSSGHNLITKNQKMEELTSTQMSELIC